MAIKTISIPVHSDIEFWITPPGEGNAPKREFVVPALQLGLSADRTVEIRYDDGE